MNIYEHDETAVGELDKRRIPVLNGEIFCSPFCGAMCKKSDYDNAVTTANEIAVQLGDGWVAQVFENLGWHWLVKKGSVEVRMSSSGYYNATMQQCNLTTVIISMLAPTIKTLVKLFKK